MFLKVATSKVGVVRKGICSENIGYAKYSVYLSRGVGICRFLRAVENLFFLSLCFVVKRTYEGQHGGLNEYDSKNLSSCLNVGDDAHFSV